MSGVVDVQAVRKARRSELGAFLKSRRARISPEDVGLPPGPRRRTPGLRREEVAQLSGVGVTWYTWLEQGRSINVSVQVLNSVARALSLDAAEKAHLYRLADVPTVPTAHAGTALPEELQVILDHVEPLPGVVLSARYDVLAHNEAYEALCPGFLTGERNVARRVFLTPECCNTYQHNWDDLRRMVGYLRGAYAKNLGDPYWEEFIVELCSESPNFKALWARNDVAVPVSRTKQVRNLAVGELEMFLTSMSLPSVPHAWMQVYTPTDEVAWAKLRELLAMSEQERQRPWVEHREQVHVAAG
ncbi:helix-turn-helix transcriptional regulator [Nocardia sp. NBC_01009]|uniref:helix-turn-helix transcriptional regulator n=1 Tax=Nocardia sp. NBC_01009 TaxID=2975996 RepID=UPI0038634125|nr:helix-turn-helix transcriptional regulator [Nocardia sp. NBC_01009]